MIAPSIAWSRASIASAGRLPPTEEVQGEEFGRIDCDSMHAVDRVAENRQVAFVGDDLLQVGGDDPFALGHGAISFWY
jgi:hypothetical protein